MHRLTGVGCLVCLGAGIGNQFEKKIRNIVFRLNKLEKIKRKTRGIYVAT
jgi:hypothetical protein